MQSCICQQPTRGSWTRSALRGGAPIESLLPIVQPRLPTDLREWVSPWQIRTWIEQELSRLDWSDPLLAQRRQPHLECQPRAMLRLLSFAYATGLFSSREIVEEAWSDATLRGICDGQSPLAQEVRAFRRYNRSVLKLVLAGVFMRAVITRLSLDAGRLSSEIEQELRDRAAERLEIAWQTDTDDE